MAERDKYKELFSLSKELLFREHEHFVRVEHKAAALLGVFSILTPVVVYFSTWSLNHILPPDDTLDWILAALAGSMVLSAGVTWIRLLSVLRLAEFERMPLNEEMLTFFVKNDEIDIYYALARGNADAHERNRRVTEQKTIRLAGAYRQVFWTILAISLFAWMYLVQVWNPPVGGG